jgi:hypothetical protein
MEIKCPVCGRDDMLEKVSDIFATRQAVDNVQFPPPKEPANILRLLVPILAEAPLAIGIPFLISERTEIWGIAMLTASMVISLVLVNDHYQGKGIFRLTPAELHWLRQMERWRQARLCWHDHCIFDLESQEYTTPEKFIGWLKLQ